MQSGGQCTNKYSTLRYKSTSHVHPSESSKMDWFSIRRLTKKPLAPNRLPVVSFIILMKPRYFLSAFYRLNFCEDSQEDAEFLDTFSTSPDKLELPLRVSLFISPLALLNTKQIHKLRGKGDIFEVMDVSFIHQLLALFSSQLCYKVGISLGNQKPSLLRLVEKEIFRSLITLATQDADLVSEMRDCMARMPWDKIDEAHTNELSWFVPAARLEDPREAGLQPQATEDADVTMGESGGPQGRSADGGDITMTNSEGPQGREGDPTLIDQDQDQDMEGGRLDDPTLRDQDEDEDMDGGGQDDQTGTHPEQDDQQQPARKQDPRLRPRPNAPDTDSRGFLVLTVGLRVRTGYITDRINFHIRKLFLTNFLLFRI